MIMKIKHILDLWMMVEWEKIEYVLDNMDIMDICCSDIPPKLGAQHKKKTRYLDDD